MSEHPYKGPRVPAKVWRRACAWVARSRNNPFVQTNPRTSGYCAGYLAAMRAQAKQKKRAAASSNAPSINSAQQDLFA